MVITCHSYGPYDPLLLIGSSGKLVMPIFFFLSGLLITQSIEHSSSNRNFLWRRALRIYPGAWLAILVSACVIGPLVTTLPLRTYFTHPLFFQYLSNCFLVKVYFYLPGVFEHSIVGPFVNSSIWSLSLEIKLYILLVFTTFIPKKICIPLTAIVVLLLVIIGEFFYSPVETRLKDLLSNQFVLSSYTDYTVYFLVGNLCYYLHRHITIRNYWLPVIVVAWAAVLHSPFEDLIYFLLLPASVLFFSANQIKWIHAINPKADLSYGIYLWAFPAEQLITNYLHPANLTISFFLILLFITPIAFFSWTIVEKPALGLKRKIR